MKFTQPASLHATSKVALSSLILVGALAGCGTHHGTHPATGAAATNSLSSAAKSASADPVIVQHPLPKSSDIRNVPAKRADVQIGSCSQIGHSWQATGTAQNRGKKPTSYAITVFFTTDHGTVQDYALATVKADPGRTVRWTATKEFPGAASTRCVLRGVG